MDKVDGQKTEISLNSYYPLAVGNSWVYSTAFREQAQPDLSVSIVKSEKGYFFDNRPQPSRLKFDGVGLRDGTVRYLLKGPIEKGNKWMSVADIRTVEHYEIVDVAKTVKVPAGVFKDCVLVRMEVRINEKRSMENYMTFAPGVGIVKIQTKVKKGAEEMIQTSMELKKYEVN
jgi:hypothetical protein